MALIEVSDSAPLAAGDLFADRRHAYGQAGKWSIRRAFLVVVGFNALFWIASVLAVQALL